MTVHKLDRLKAAVKALGTDVTREAVRDLIYASGAALRQGAGLTTDEIETILMDVPTAVDHLEEYPG